MAGLARSLPDLSQFLEQNYLTSQFYVFLHNLLMPNLCLIFSFRIMDLSREKRTKTHDDGVGTSKRCRKSIGRDPAPPLDSSSSDHYEDEELEALKMYTPVVSGNWVRVVYSKKTALHTLIDNREAPVYMGQWMCTDRWFWSFFHVDWYCLVYLPKCKPVVETNWVNWEWMTSKRTSISITSKRLVTLLS
jgi:hypothetical protein